MPPLVRRSRAPTVTIAAGIYLGGCVLGALALTLGTSERVVLPLLVAVGAIAPTLLLSRAQRVYQADTEEAQARQAIERFLALLLIVLTAPMMFVIAIAIRCTSEGPVLFSQRRLRPDGREFRLFKFRTMRVIYSYDAPVFASTGDPRVTPVGRFLRRTSMDELPGLFSVVRGNLSLIGPPPWVLEAHYLNRTSILETSMPPRPGLISWAQLHGFYGDSQAGREANTEWIVRGLQADLNYAQRRSLRLDVALLGLWLFRHKRSPAPE